MERPGGTTRRRTVLCGAVVGLLGAGALAGCGGTTPRRRGGTGTATPGTPLIALAELPVGGGRLVDVDGGGRLLVVRPSEDEARAFDPTCPHAGALVGEPGGGVVTCPTHGSQFDAASGELLQGPARSGLTPIPVRVEDGQVVLA